MPSYLAYLDVGQALSLYVHVDAAV